MEKSRYFHGTSSTLNIARQIKSPIETSVLRQKQRDFNHEVVYVTTSLGTAANFAVKAVRRFGGVPVIYEVEPDSSSLSHYKGTEWITKSAKIIKTL